MKRKKKTWTIMLYMAGDNNLAEEMILALQQLKEIGLNTDQFYGVARFDSGGPLRQFVIGDEQSTPRAALPEQLDLPEVAFPHRVINDKEVVLRRAASILKHFITSTISMYPADYYMLVLSGHGSGAVGDFLPSNHQPTKLSIRDLKSILRAATSELKHEEQFKGKIDLLGFDSCLMSMAEVAYQMRDYVHYVVGSEGFEPNTGWPYGRLLRGLNSLVQKSEPDLLKPDNIAKEIVNVYVRNYVDYKYADLSTDQAALDLKRIPYLKEKLDDLAGLLLKELHRDEVKDAITLAHWEAQGYKFEQYTDLFDFCKRLASRCKTFAEGVVTKSTDVMNEIEGADPTKDREKIPPLVINSCYTGAAFQHSHGLSVFFPWAKVIDAAGVAELDIYAQLDFGRAYDPDKDPEKRDKESLWVRFLNEYLKQTQRQVRNGNKDVSPNDSHLQFEESRLNERNGFFGATVGKFDPDSDPRFDPDSDPRFPELLDPRFDPDSDPRFGRAPKIASMKNPAIRWRLCRPK